MFLKTVDICDECQWRGIFKFLVYVGMLLHTLTLCHVLQTLKRSHDVVDFTGQGTCLLDEFEKFNMYVFRVDRVHIMREFVHGNDGVYNKCLN